MMVPSGAIGLTWTTRVKVAVAPLAIDAAVQFTVPGDPAAGVVQVQPAGVVMDWKVVSAGSSSFIASLAPVFRPAFPTRRSSDLVPPGRTGSGESVLVMLRSASAR